MKLADRNPRWIGIGRPESGVVRFGLSFECPHCSTQRLGVFFKPMIDPDNWEARMTPIPLKTAWTRVSGDTFDTLTLTPSIDAMQFSGHWHGHITNGEIV